MLLTGEKFDFKQRTLSRGWHQNTKLFISQNCHFVVTAFFLWGSLLLRGKLDYPTSVAT